MTLSTAGRSERAPPLGLGPRGLLPNLYDVVIFVLIASAFVLLAHGAREMGAPLTQLDIAPVTIGTNHLLGVNVLPEDSAPPQGAPIDIVSLGPAAAFVVATKIAFYGGLVIASPFIFFFVAHFVFPALKIREKRYIYRGLTFGFGLFLTGVSFCYFIMMPMALAVSAKYAEWFGFKANQWRAEEYIDAHAKSKK
jgi:Sec-independent protein secretion pathway component TatC